MTEAEVAELLGLAALVDQRKIDDPTVMYWHKILADVRYDYAIEALDEFRRTSTEYLVPGHITQGVARYIAKHGTLAERYPGRRVIE